jgi:hypothetical protein
MPLCRLKEISCRSSRTDRFGVASVDPLEFSFLRALAGRGLRRDVHLHLSRLFDAGMVPPYRTVLQNPSPREGPITSSAHRVYRPSAQREGNDAVHHGRTPRQSEIYEVVKIGREQITAAKPVSLRTHAYSRKAILQRSAT